MKFIYKATNQEGEIVEGASEAKDKFELNRILRSEGMSLLSAEEEGEGNIFQKIGRKLSEFGTVSQTEKINFGRNLGSMLEAGLALSRALSVMERQAKNRAFKKVVHGLSEAIKRGMSFSGALGEYPKVFPPLFVSMVAAGEESGNMAEALHVVSSQMDKTLKLKKKIRGAMVYPGVIIGAMLVIAVFLFMFVVPTLTKTFVELGLDLPATTQFIISTSDLVQNHFILMAGTFVGAIALFIFGIRTKMGNRIFAWTLIHMPMIKSLVKETNAARTTRTLASLLASGVPYIRSIQITGDVVQNVYYKDVIRLAEKNIQLGLPVAKIFEENDTLYPIFVSEMIAVGEETGELSKMLTKVAEYYEEEVEQKTKNLSTIIEPLLMIFVGGAVGFFALSMISPMYSLVDNI